MSWKCGQCDAVLSQGNQGTLCFPCQEKRLEELRERLDDSPYYGVDDMCYLLELGPEQVRRRGRKGKTPGKLPGVKKHLYLKVVVDQWIRSGGKLPKPEVETHYSELALTALKLAEILDYYYKAERFSIVPMISSDFPFTSHPTGTPKLNEREFSNLMDHLKGEIPELASIAEYPSACKRYFAGNSILENDVPTAEITGDLILKLKLIANQGNFPGRCPDCPN